jgi:hypothetical protein
MRNYKAVLGVLAILLSVSAGSAAPTLTFKFKAITIPGATQVFTGGVSDTGVIVGGYEDTGGALHGFTLKGTTVTTSSASPGEVRVFLCRSQS